MSATTWKHITIAATSYYAEDSIAYRFRTNSEGLEEWQIQKTNDLDLSFVDVETAIENLKEAAEGLENTMVTVENREDRGGSNTSVYLQGWSSDVTPEQVIAAKAAEIAQVAAVEKRERERAERVILDLKVRFPDLFPEA
jgi:hypothetical protein